MQQNRIKEQKNKHLVDEFILTIDVINSDMEIVQTFGEIKTDLGLKGFPLSDADIFIASMCLSKCDKLISGNIKHFDRIENLNVENWIR